MKKKRRRKRWWWWSQRILIRGYKGNKLPRRKKAPTTKWQTKNIGEFFLNVLPPPSHDF